MKHYLKLIGLGFIIWLVPFVTAFFFYTPDGQLAVDKFLFKTVMIITASLTGTIIVVKLFSKPSASALRLGFEAGFIFLLINWLLDFTILIPMSGMGLGDYFIEIGLRYLPILFTALGGGFIVSALQNQPSTQ